MVIREYSDIREEELERLYGAVGWTAYTRDMPLLLRGYENSLLALAAYEEGELMGIARAVGDGETVVFVQDLLVYPRWQRRGVGTALLRAVIERYPGVRQIQLTADFGGRTEAFYRSAGFCELSEAGCRGFMLRR